MARGMQSGPEMYRSWPTKSRARVFQGPNFDTGDLFIPGSIMEWAGRPRVTNVIGFEYLTCNTSEATSPI